MVATPLPMLPYVDEAERERHERRLERDRRRREQGKQTYFESDATVDSGGRRRRRDVDPVRPRPDARRARSTLEAQVRWRRQGLAIQARAIAPPRISRRRPSRTRSRRLARSGVIFAIATGLSRVIGLVREIAQAAVFGINGPVNAFEIAFLHPEHGAVARRRLGSLGGVRSCLQRPAREGRAQARVAGRLVGVLADAARPGRPDGAVRRHRAVGDGDLRLRAGRAVRRPRGRARALLFPIVLVLGLTGIVVGILNSYDHFTVPALSADRVEPRDPPRPRPRRRELASSESTRLYYYAVAILVATIVQFLLPLPWLRGLRRPAAHGDRHPRPGREADVRADAAGDDRPRPDQPQRGRSTSCSRRTSSTRPSRRRRSSARSGSTCCRRASSRSPSRRCCSRCCRGTPRARTGRRSSRRWRRAAADLLPARYRRARRRPSSRRRSCGCSTSTASSRRAATHDRRAVPRGVRARPDLQRDDADAQPRLLLAPVAVDPDRRRVENLGINAVLDAVFYRFGIWGIPLSTSLVNIAGTWALLVLLPAAGRQLRDDETAESFVLVGSRRLCSPLSRGGSGISSTRRSASRCRRRSSPSAAGFSSATRRLRRVPVAGRARAGDDVATATPSRLTARSRRDSSRETPPEASACPWS